MSQKKHPLSGILNYRNSIFETSTGNQNMIIAMNLEKLLHDNISRYIVLNYNRQNQENKQCKISKRGRFVDTLYV